MFARSILFIILLYTLISHSTEAVKIGGVKPLFSAGQDVLAAHQVSVASFLQQLGGLEYHLVEWASVLKYGWSDSLTTAFILPILAEEFSRANLKGLGNITFGIEYCLYKKDQIEGHQEWTCIASLLLPTAAQRSNNIPLLIGNNYVSSFDINLAQPTTSYFIGTTFHHVDVSHYASSACTVLIQTNTKKNHYRPTLCCDIAFGQLFHFNRGLVISLLLEMNGRFRPSTTVNRIVNDHSGSYRLWLGPTLRCTWGGLRLHAGFQYPVVERFFAPRIAPNYRIALGISIH